MIHRSPTYAGVPGFTPPLTTQVERMKNGPIFLPFIASFIREEFWGDFPRGYFNSK